MKAHCRVFWSNRFSFFLRPCLCVGGEDDEPSPNLRSQLQPLRSHHFTPAFIFLQFLLITLALLHCDLGSPLRCPRNRLDLPPLNSERFHDANSNSKQFCNPPNCMQPNPMANSYTVLGDLRAGRCSNTAEVRLLRFWEARNINRRGQLLSLEMLLVDEHATVVHGSISASIHLTFRGHLTEGSVYTLCGFDVTRSHPKFSQSDAPVSIRFNEATVFEKTSTIARIIPAEHFRFRSYEQILELANTGKQLSDVMGEIRAIRSTITDCLPGAPQVMLTLRLERNVDVCVSMFDSLAHSFHIKFDGFGKEPKIVLVTGINPKIVSGKLYLNGTSATRVFFDCETTVGKEAFNRFPGCGSDQGKSETKEPADVCAPALTQPVAAGLALAVPSLNNVAAKASASDDPLVGSEISSKQVVEMSGDPLQGLGTSITEVVGLAESPPKKARID